MSSRDWMGLNVHQKREITVEKLLLVMERQNSMLWNQEWAVTKLRKNIEVDNLTNGEITELTILSTEIILSYAEINNDLRRLTGLLRSLQSRQKTD
jgi:hypothetical protein